MTAIVTDAIDALAAPVVHARVTRVRAHRPWPMPRRPWIMGQTWCDLLFAHWDVPESALRKAVPAQLTLETYEGRAWIGVTPFAVRNLRVRLTFPLPFVSVFPEINVRTYVTVDGRPGIYFFSLDADSALAVTAARRAYRLPYFRADMSVARSGDEVRYESRRTAPEAPAPARFRARYRPVGEVFNPKPGSLEHWLSERYCLYTVDDAGEPRRAEIQHPPWALQAAQATIETNTMGAEVGLDLDGEPLLHYARRQDVVFWSLEHARGNRITGTGP